MRMIKLLVIAILIWTLAACDLPASITGTQAASTSMATLESTATPYIPPGIPPLSSTETNQIILGDMISIHNAQALQVGAEVLEGQAQAFSWMPGGEQVALTVDQGIMVYVVESATVANHLEALKPSNLTNAENAQWLAWVSNEHTIQIFDTQENRQMAEIQSTSGPVTSLSLASESGKIAFSTFDNQVQVWEGRDGSFQMYKEWQLPYWLTDLAFSPDGTTLAGADLTNFKVHLFDLESGEEMRSLMWTEHASPALYGVEFSPDWKYLAWVARGSVMIMDLESGEPLANLEHEDFVSAYTWSGDGQLLATAAAGTLNGEFRPMVYLWEASTGALVNQLAQQASVLSMSFSPDGRELAVLTSGGALQIWQVAP